MDWNKAGNCREIYAEMLMRAREVLHLLGDWRNVFSISSANRGYKHHVIHSA